ncbi:MAG: hypothetical protein IJ204_01035 [Paludibacteraceae bacterium]|nr:hypothetical protein [Paludibacteraceae bacterium]
MKTLDEVTVEKKAAAEMSPLFLCPMTSGGMDIENITPALSTKRAGRRVWLCPNVIRTQ